MNSTTALFPKANKNTFNFPLHKALSGSTLISMLTQNCETRLRKRLCIYILEVYINISMVFMTADAVSLVGP